MIAHKMIKNVLALWYTIAIFLSFMNVSAVASSPSGDQDLGGAYEHVKVPTNEELKQLQDFALKSGVDLNGILHEMPEEEIEPWTKVFALSLRFNELDRMSQVYGYRLFSAFTYYIGSCGVEKFGKLLDAQKSEVRQRIRDFLFYDAVMAGTDIHSRQEERFRRTMPSVFPTSYCFGKDDKLFADLK